MSWSSPTAAERAEREAALDRLRDLCPPGTQVHLVLEHASRSGMQRSIKAYVFDTDHGQTHWLNGLIERAGIARRWKSQGRTMDGSVMGGCGMDMGFQLVYTLGRALYPAGFGCIGDRCPSNDHSNGDRDRTPHDQVRATQFAPADPHEPEPFSTSAECIHCHEPLRFHDEVFGNHCPRVFHWHQSGGYALTHQWL